MSEVVTGLIGGLVGYSLAKEKPPTDAEIVDYLRERKPIFFRNVPIDTSVARENVEIPSAGILLFVENPGTPTKSVYVKLNEPDSEKIDLTTQRKIRMPFYRLFISNEAGVGILNLVVCKTSIVELAEAVVNMKITAQTAEIEIKITAATIMLPVDLQASYIMLPVDIQAQYVTLDINIKAQTANVGIDIKAQTIGNLAVNIAASAITLNVDIKAATAKVGITLNIADIVGNLPIDIKAATIGNIGIDIKAQTLGQVNINLAASAITLNVNIASQGAFYLNVNIAAQFANIDVTLKASAITLNVNISSQTANINVDIKASSVTMNVSVTGTANIQITAQTVGVWVGGEWEAKEGNDVQIYGTASLDGGVDGLVASFFVPAGKKLYISYFGGGRYNATEAVTGGRLYDLVAAKTYAVGHGMQGFWGTFPKPIVVDSSRECRLYVYNGGAGAATCRGCFGGILK